MTTEVYLVVAIIGLLGTVAGIVVNYFVARRAARIEADRLQLDRDTQELDKHRLAIEDRDGMITSMASMLVQYKALLEEYRDKIDQLEAELKLTRDEVIKLRTLMAQYQGHQLQASSAALAVLSRESGPALAQALAQAVEKTVEQTVGEAPESAPKQASA